jgi:DNA-binding NtrC family response regulator
VDLLAWLALRNWAGPLTSTDVLTALRGAGISDAGAEPTAAVHGVLLFGRVTPGLIVEVHELSMGGTRPLLAVAATGSALADGVAWQLLAAGASDVLAWDRSEHPADDVAARLERWLVIDELQHRQEIRDRLIGESPAWRSTLRQVAEAAHFTRAPVLITGESGTGKELVARLIHALDPRPQRGDFVVLDCTTVVPTLSGSEFFGHDKGAFTGAISTRDGAFALADQGTLFLDEVSELPLPLQAELLRVIQEGMYKRLGSNTWRRTTFRLVSATNRDLVQEQSLGRFRTDLFYRLAGWSFRLPSLAERRSDIPQLARHFLGRLDTDRPPPRLDAQVEALLVGRDYPGNVRDLRQFMSRVAARHVGSGPISVGDIPPDDRPADATHLADDLDLESAVRQALGRGLTLKDITQRAGDTAVRVALEDERWNLQRAAARLGVTNRALQLRRARGRSGAAHWRV